MVIIYKIMHKHNPTDMQTSDVIYIRTWRNILTFAIPDTMLWCPWSLQMLLEHNQLLLYDMARWSPSHHCRPSH